MTRPSLAQFLASRRRVIAARAPKRDRVAGRRRVHRLALLDGSEALTLCGLRLGDAESRLDHGALWIGRPCRNCDRSERRSP